MKKLLLSIVFLFGLLVQSNAQNTFAPVGAEWWYYNNYSDNPEGFFNQLKHTQAISDTTLLGITCSKIITTKFNRYGGQPAIEMVDTTLFLYGNSDTVFVYNNIFNRFTPLYVFNVQIGDTICLPVPPYSNDLRTNPYTGDTSFCFVIDTIILKTYDTIDLKTYFTQSITSYEENHILGDYPSFSYGNKQLIYGDGSYTELVGGNYGILPVQRISSWGSTVIPFGPSGNLHCYADDSVAITKIDGSSLPCDDLPPFIWDKINEMTYPSAISIYPNPSNGNFTISLKEVFKKNISIDLLDMSGRKISQYTIPAYQNTWQIQNNSLHPGVYTLIFNTEQGKYYKKMVVQ